MQTINTKKNKEQYLEHLRQEFSIRVFLRKELKDFNNRHGYKNIKWFLDDPQYKVSHGKYSLNTNSSETISESTATVSFEQPEVSESAMLNAYTSNNTTENMVPKVDPLFVKHGHYNLINKIISSKQFYPIFVTGLSGNGKTFGIEQACANANREMFRVNITIETDEDDLLGGFRLVNDCTKWFDGPVIRAMKTGGVLLLDEVDLGSNKLLCLQPVLEGKGILLKKINQYVTPAPGFTIIATANTKGQGSESGKFIGTNILNEAFLERFCATFEQEYPTEAIEKKIIERVFNNNDLSDSHIEDFVMKLVTWAFGTRKTYESGGTSDLISTRRLVHIANAYNILGHPTDNDVKAIGKVRKQAIEMCISRFDEYTKESFMNFYTAIDPYVSGNPVETSNPDVVDFSQMNDSDISTILSNGS